MFLKELLYRVQFSVISQNYILFAQMSIKNNLWVEKKIEIILWTQGEEQI